MKLSDYLKKETNLSDESIETIENLWTFDELPKGQQVLTEGSRSKKIYFVEEGLLRLYYFKDGKDITHQFFTESNIYAPIENIFLNQQFPYNLELLENCTIRTVDYSLIEKYLEDDLKLQSFVRYVAITAIKRLSDHLHSLQFQSAQERYSNLLNSHPDILLRAPLGHIASYLGITQSTLSVIRSEKAK